MNQGISKKPLFKEFAILIFFIFTLDSFAHYVNLYTEKGEFDSGMHFLAGISVVLATLWVYFFSGLFNPRKRYFWNFFVISLLGITFVGVLWEVMELALGITGVSGKNYTFDTSLDFIMDLLGGIVACLYGYMKEVTMQSGVVVIKGEPPANLPV